MHGEQIQHGVARFESALPHRARRGEPQQQGVEPAADWTASRWHSAIQVIGEAEAAGMLHAFTGEVAEAKKPIERDEVKAAFASELLRQAFGAAGEVGRCGSG